MSNNPFNNIKLHVSQFLNERLFHISALLRLNGKFNNNDSANRGNRFLCHVSRRTTGTKLSLDSRYVSKLAYHPLCANQSLFFYRMTKIANEVFTSQPFIRHRPLSSITWTRSCYHIASPHTSWLTATESAPVLNPLPGEIIGE